VWLAVVQGFARFPYKPSGVGLLTIISLINEFSSSPANIQKKIYWRLNLKSDKNEQAKASAMLSILLGPSPRGPIVT
jgi:hypothetical protein